MRAGDLAKGRGTWAGLETLLDALIPGTPRRFRVIDATADFGFAILGDATGAGRRRFTGLRSGVSAAERRRCVGSLPGELASLAFGSAGGGKKLDFHVGRGHVPVQRALLKAAELEPRAGLDIVASQHLARREITRANEQEPTIDQAVQLGGPAATRAAYALLEVPPFAPDAERWAFTWVASIEADE